MIAGQVDGNDAIAAIFDDIADLLELEDANPFRIRAYRNAARTLINSCAPPCLTAWPSYRSRLQAMRLNSRP